MKPILAIVFIFSSFLIMFFLSWPEYQGLREAMLESEIKTADLENMKNYNQIISNLYQKLKIDHREDVQKIKDGVPDDHYAPSLFAEIRRISYKTGVRVERLGDFSVRNHRNRAGIKEIEISFRVEGSYQNFKNFLSKINESARMMTIESLRIESSSTPEDRRSLLEYNVTIKTYSY